MDKPKSGPMACVKALLAFSAIAWLACAPESKPSGNQGGEGGEDAHDNGGASGKGSAGKGGAGNSGGAGGAGNRGGNAAGAGGAAGADDPQGGMAGMAIRSGFTFEGGIDRWQTSSLARFQESVELAIATSPVSEGTNSLEVTVDVDILKSAENTPPDGGATVDAGMGQCFWPRCPVYVGVQNPTDFQLAGGTEITFRVFVPQDVPIHSVQPFVMTKDQALQKWTWFGAWMGASMVTRGQWQAIKLVYPETTEDLWEIGVEFVFEGAGKHKVYVDNVTW